MSTVFQMVRQVLADSKEKLASEQRNGAKADSAFTKSAQEKCPDCDKPKEECSCEEKSAGVAGLEYDPIKVADACDYLAENLHLVTDDRTPHEKLAEYAAIRQAIEKRAMGDEPQGPHQKTQANPDSVSPMTPGASNSAQMGAGANQMDSGQNNAPGTGIEAGGGGSATADKVIDKAIEPNEKAFPADVNNSLETNNGEENRPGGQEMMVQKIASMRARKLGQLVAAGQITKEAAAAVIRNDRIKVAALEGATVDPGWVDSQQAMYRAMRRGGEGVDQLIADPELIGERMTGSLKGGVKGLGIGALGGAAAGGLASLISKGKIPSRAVGGGALLGGALGGGIGSIAGQVGAEGDYLRRRGIDPQLGGLMGAKMTPEAAQKYLSQGTGGTIKKAGAESRLAKAILAKFAEDAINPAQLSAGSEPDLQSAAGVPSPLSQGTEAGEQVPDTKGGDSGRQLIQSVTAAINATKGDAKNVKSEMRKHLDEPAHSSAHDSVLQKSLDNTSSAGVKIAATKALLQKWAEQSPEHAARLAEATQRVKHANVQMGYGPDAGGMAASGVPGASGPAASGVPGAGMTGGMSMPAPGGAAKTAMGEGMEPVSDAALAAAAQGVSPEEIAQAEAMLEAQMAPPAEAAMAAPPAEEAPPAPAEGGPPAGAPPAGA